MATASGIDAQVGMVAEVTYGTPVTVTRFYELVSESLKNNIARVQSRGIRPGRHVTHRWKPGAQSVTGDIVMELAPHEAGLWMTQLLGTPATTGAGPYTHTYTGPKNNDATSLTIQIGRPDEGGTVRAFTYAGMRMTQLQIGAAVGEYVMATTSWYGQSEETNIALATAVYDAELEPFVFTEATLTVAGSAVPVKNFELNIDRNLAVDRHRLGTALPRKALINGLASVTGSFTADFVDLTSVYNRYVAGTEGSLVLTFTSLVGAADCVLTITMNVRFDGETPNVTGPEILELPMNFVATSETSDAAAFTAVIVNDDSVA